MKEEDKILIKVPASEPPKESREYPCIVKLIDTEIYEQIYFNNISGEWSCYTGTVIAWLRPASIEEIKQRYGLFDKEDMKNVINESHQITSEYVNEFLDSTGGEMRLRLNDILYNYINEKYPEYGKV